MTHPSSRRAAWLAAAFLAFLPLASRAQRPPDQLDAAAILHRMQRLSVVGGVLYVAAHPDDENTRLIAALANGRALRTAYVSLTRGDGGQNLIGTEMSDALGILRTDELLEARRIDGGEQFFTRAVDFGFSKTPDETFAKWDREAVLADLVRVVRTVRPDVMITRFDVDGSGGHGHHTASALLAREAFARAADPRAFPEQIAAGLEPWQPRRLFFNGSTWWNAKLADVAAADPEHWFTLDVGGFDALLGTSYTELAGRSRSQHKSQGFGAPETRGELPEYLRLDLGDRPTGRDPFDGLDTSWARVPGAERVPALVEHVLSSYDVRHPEASLDELVELSRALDALAAPGSPARAWATPQARLARELCLQVVGLSIEVGATRPMVAPGEALDVTTSVLQRRAGPAIRWIDLAGPGVGPTAVDVVLTPNRARTLESKGVVVPAALSQPHWLAASDGNTGATRGLYVPREGTDGTAATWPSPLTYRVRLLLPGDHELEVERPLVHTWVDRVAGQRTRLVAVTPVVSLEPVDPVVLVRGERAQVEVEVEARVADLAGTVSVAVPSGWTVDATAREVATKTVGERRRVVFEVTRGPDAAAGDARFTFASPRGTTNLTRHAIDHPHVPVETWFTSSRARLVPLDVAVDAHRVGYVAGAGDEIPTALRRLGIEVETIDPAAGDALDLDLYDAIVTGIRAYNTQPALARFQERLLAYVERGGTLVVQYVTNGSDLVLDARRIGPRPFTVSRTRVTVEDAPVTLLAPEHPLLARPNRIRSRDFDGWIQERGLYFAGEPDPAYVALVSWNDPGEPAANGGWIACDHGRGRFVYTGLSLFRQLPAGVPGAYRLLANLVARREPRAGSSGH